MDTACSDRPSRGRARLGSTGRVSALKGAEALLERIGLATHTRIRHTGAVVGSEYAGRVVAIYSDIAADAGALAKGVNRFMAEVWSDKFHSHPR